jgi:hypothetical protein
MARAPIFSEGVIFGFGNPVHLPSRATQTYASSATAGNTSKFSVTLVIELPRSLMDCRLFLFQVKRLGYVSMNSIVRTKPKQMIRFMTLVFAVLFMAAMGASAASDGLDGPNGPADSVDPVDLCAQAAVTATPTRPTWDYPAATTQCGVSETESGWLDQSMGAGVSQRMAVAGIRFGLTPRLDLRWGVVDHIFQSGGGLPSLQGAGDQWLGARYRFHEQGWATPAMALLYCAKIPMANPAKGFGSGFVDHQFLFIASRDLGRYHVDFNTVGTVIGESHAHDGAAQFGMALTRPLSRRLAVILESYGGPQPGISDRFGAGLAGASYTLRPQLVMDAAYTRTYTAGSPRQQVLFGVTYARRAGFPPLPRGGLFTRLLGR